MILSYDLLPEAGMASGIKFIIALQRRAVHTQHTHIERDTEHAPTRYLTITSSLPSAYVCLLGLVVGLVFELELGLVYIYTNTYTHIYT